VWGSGFRVLGFRAAKRRRVTRESPKLCFRSAKRRRVTPPGSSLSIVLNLRTTTSQKCEAVPRRARIQGSWNFESLNSRLESNKEEKKSGSRCVIHPPTLTERPNRPSSDLGCTFKSQHDGSSSRKISSLELVNLVVS